MNVVDYETGIERYERELNQIAVQRELRFSEIVDLLQAQVLLACLKLLNERLEK